MTEIVLEDGYSRLRLVRDPDGSVQMTIHDEGKPGHTFTAGRRNLAEILAFLRPPTLFETRPEDYQRDQYEPRDFAEEKR